MEMDQATVSVGMWVYVCVCVCVCVCACVCVCVCVCDNPLLFYVSQCIFTHLTFIDITCDSIAETYLSCINLFHLFVFLSTNASCVLGILSSHYWLRNFQIS